MSVMTRSMRTPWRANQAAAPRRKAAQVVMMLATEGLRVALATTHVPLREVSDRITVLRDGRTVGVYKGGEISAEGIVEAMTGDSAPLPDPPHGGGGRLVGKGQPLTGEVRWG